MTMDYVQKFDIELDKEIYYAGEIISGRVSVITTENIKVKGKSQGAETVVFVKSLLLL